MFTHDPRSRRDFLRSSAGLAAAALAAPAAFAAEAPPGPAQDGWQIGCYTRPWDKHELGAALDAIAEAGFKHVGLMTIRAKSGLVISAATTPDEARQVGEEARKRGLSIPSAYCGDIPVARSIEAGVEGMKRLIDHCVAAGAANLLMGGTGDPKLYDAYYKAIAEGCPYAAERRIGVSVKPHGGLNATGPLCRKAIQLVGQRNFGLWYDPGNVYYYSNGEVDPVADAATVDGLVVGMSVKDYMHPRNVAVTPGTGKVNFAAVMARLRQGGFTRGPLIVETLAPGELPALLGEARKARQFVEALVAQKS